MRKYIDNLKELAFSGTAKDTYILFTGNVGSAFWGFLFTLLVARSLSIYDFGIFSAVINLVNILSSLADLGISSGAVNFVAEHWGQGNRIKTDEYLKASFILRLIVTLSISAVVLLFSPYISVRLLASNNASMAIWTSIIVLFWFFDLFFPYILQAKKM